MFVNFTLVQEAEVEDDDDDDDSMDNETTEADEQVIPKPCFVLLECNDNDNINDNNNNNHDNNNNGCNPENSFVRNSSFHLESFLIVRLSKETMGSLVTGCYQLPSGFYPEKLDLYK